jgi:lipopolysaccharide/colanic/teichoic acid biosynthesis glycosyltransferase
MAHQVGAYSSRNSLSASLERDRTLYRLFKRWVDVILAAALLLLLCPLLLCISVAIALDSSGPVIFEQERVGSRRRRAGKAEWEGQAFTLYKFRTMAHNADQTVHRAFIKAFVQGQVNGGQDGTHRAPFKLTHDHRVTGVGKFLRKTSLDELPQLYNVLKGDMSLVGPRPVPIYEVEQYKSWHWERLAVTPGLTGLWQVRGRSAVSYDEMIRMDLDYVAHQSTWLDVQILLMTIPAVLAGRGAY